MRAISETNAELRQGKKKTRIEQARGIPPPPLAPGAAARFPDFSHDEASASASASTPSPTNRMMHPTSSSSAMRCDLFTLRGQTTLDASWHKNKFVEARKAMANFWYYSGIPLNEANSPYWEYMIRAIASCDGGIKAPTCSDLRGPMLQDAVIDCRRVIDERKKIWKRKGCSILSDVWTDQAGRTLLNFLACSSGGLVFLKSVDASGEVKTGEYLAGQLRLVIEDVGPENVVQVISDNSANYAKAGEIIEREFPTISWTPCAVRVLNLLLEDIGKVAWIKEIVEKGRAILQYINNHAWVLNLMRTKYTNGKNLLRPGATRFASSILTLHSIHTNRLALKQMFVSDEWMQSVYAHEADGKYVVHIVFDEDYWSQCHQILKITKPLMRVLRLVDSNNPSMGYVYEAMDRAKKAIIAYFSHDREKFGYIWDMVDQRWIHQLHKPLHGAGLYLNPKFFFSEKFDITDGEINKSLHMAINHLVPDKEIRLQIYLVELQYYKKANGYLFNSPECIKARTTLAPDLWWEDYGGKTPNLQKLAIKILSQPTSASGCEQNWRTFSHIHTKMHNRLTQEHLNDLVFVHYNLRYRRIEGTSNEAMELDEIDYTSDSWASWLKDAPLPNQVQDFDITFDEYQRMEEAIAMAEETERAAMVTDKELTPAAGPSGSGVQASQEREHDAEGDIDDEQPLVWSRFGAAKKRSRKGKYARGT